MPRATGSPDASGRLRPRARRGDESAVEIGDDTWVDVPSPVVAAVVADDRNFSMWWPHLRPLARIDRGTKGQQWQVDGQVVGVLGIRLEPFWDGTIVHHYVHGNRGPGAPRDVSTRHTLRWKRAALALKDTLESARGAGL